MKNRMKLLAFRSIRWISVVVISIVLVSCAGNQQSSQVQCPQTRITHQAPASYLSMTNPLSNQADAISAGEALFQGAADPACRLCHGRKGDGLGPLATQFSVPPRNFVCANNIDEIPDGQLFWVIENGSPGTNMVGFKQLSEQQIWQLVSYIRQLANG